MSVESQCVDLPSLLRGDSTGFLSLIIIPLVSLTNNEVFPIVHTMMQLIVSASFRIYTEQSSQFTKERKSL